MKNIQHVMVAAALAVCVATVGQAQTQTFSGGTTGCFATGCTPAATGSNGHGVTFTGINSFNWLAVSGTPQTVTLGTFNFGAFSCITDIRLCSPDEFTLHTAFTAPPTVPGFTNNFADIDAAFLFGLGGGNIDFDNTPQLFNFNGGFATLTVNDTHVGPVAGNYNVTGTFVYTSTPEPTSMALLGTGLVGLVPMVRRRKK